MATPREILHDAFQRADASPGQSFVDNAEVRARIELVCRNIQNRALVRLLLACSLAKIHIPTIDIRKPYTEIGDPDAYSGRTYDEAYVTPFVLEHGLPCNPTTAFLTPALRNRNVTLTPDLNLVGRPPALYQAALQLLTDVYMGAVSPEALLAETIRWLIIVKEERRQRMETLLAGLRTTEGAMPLSTEAIVTLIEQHLRCPGSSRLPVLVVAAAYETAGVLLGEQARALTGHTAADRQTGAIGDVEVTLVGENHVVTGYEMKMRRVTLDDINIALQKIANKSIQNYIFITTEMIDPQVQEYAANLYEQTGGIEVVVLDCIGFLRHFLHFFHRLRGRYVEAYQALVLAQPESAVGQPLKEAWLALRQAAESRE
ncbi:MAG TPA: hypothetical protein VFB38_11350 [Chthonomonadaceae bacterium]|nr:hypothetical protein [Chthonomonadaceae bacterium]